MHATPATTAERDALADSIRDYASGNYAVAEVRHSTCTCGADRFEVQADDTEGCALRRCVACEQEHLICDSEEYWDESNAEQCFCTCEKGIFQVAVGFALVEDKTNVRWLYVGMRCVACGLAGVYADWKIDYGPSLHLMDQA